MTIKITLNGNEYGIFVDSSSYNPIRYGVSKANGAVTETVLGYFTKLPNAALRLIREELSTSEDTITLMEYAKRVETLNQELLNQLEAVGV